MSIGQYGRLIVPILSIISLTPYILKHRGNSKFTNANLIALLGLLIFIFSGIYYIEYNGSEMRLFIFNLFIPIYILFYFIIIKSATLYFRDESDSIGKAKLWLLKIISNSLLLNFVFWMTLSIVLGINMMDTEESIGRSGFGGFMQEKVPFGIYCLTGFLVSFYLRFNDINQDKSKINLLQIFLFLICIFFADTRNAILIIFVTLLHYLLSIKFKQVYSILIVLSIYFILFMLSFDQISFLNSNEINNLSTGRLDIWRLALEEINNRSIFKGSGIFNLNHFVISNNYAQGYYYLEQVDFLYFHSSYLEIFAAGGIIALVLFIVLIFKVWNHSSKLDRSIILGILFGAISESFLVQPFILISFLFWFLLIQNSLKYKNF